MFKDEWIPNISNPLREARLGNELCNFKVMDLIDANKREWRSPLLEVLFSQEVVRKIQTIYVPLRDVEDELVWERTGEAISR